MNDGYGREVPPAHAPKTHLEVSRYLVVIGAADRAVARLFRDDLGQVMEMDAGTEEVVQMIKGVPAKTGASGPEWDRALAGHTAEERAAATVYELDV